MILTAAELSTLSTEDVLDVLGFVDQDEDLFSDDAVSEPTRIARVSRNADDEGFRFSSALADLL